MRSEGEPSIWRALWERLDSSLSAKLIVPLIAASVAIFGLLGYLNIRLHRHDLEAGTLASAERISDVIKRSTSYYMLRNDREGLYNIISTMVNEPGMVRIRVFNKEGRISFSTEEREVNTNVDKGAEACYRCHEQEQPLERLNRPDRFRIYDAADKTRVLGIINPIENQASCSAASCHAHPADQKILGVLDVTMSLAQGDVSLAQSSRWMFYQTLAAVGIISLLTGIFIWRVVHGPLARLKLGTEKLGQGDLGIQLNFESYDELGQLAASFNTMSRQLHEEHGKNEEWTRTLEQRVDQKTRELKRAHEHMLQVEKMASIGKLGAIVAHEINNPLAGILTYAKLLKKWMARTDWTDERRAQIRSSLDLIESESRRCGDIVRNLLMYARANPINLDWASLNTVIERCVQLVQHQAEVTNIQLEVQLAADLPKVRCDPAQIQQVLVALVINAIEATPKGAVVCIRSVFDRDAKEVHIQVEDEGAGIPADLLPRLFEPFVTTKEAGHGLGLGLAVSHSIIARHHGRIDVRSAPGNGTTFTVALPVGSDGTLAAEDKLVTAESR